MSANTYCDHIRHATLASVCQTSRRFQQVTYSQQWLSLTQVTYSKQCQFDTSHILSTVTQFGTSHTLSTITLFDTKFNACGQVVRVTSALCLSTGWLCKPPFPWFINVIFSQTSLWSCWSVPFWDDRFMIKTGRFGQHTADFSTVEFFFFFF